MTTPYPEGPGLPRAPPSLKAMRWCSGGLSCALNNSLVARDEGYAGMTKVYTADNRLCRVSLGRDGRIARPHTRSTISNNGRTIRLGGRLHRAGVRSGGIRALRRDRLPSASPRLASLARARIRGIVALGIHHRTGRPARVWEFSHS